MTPTPLTIRAAGLSSPHSWGPAPLGLPELLTGPNPPGVLPDGLWAAVAPAAHGGIIALPSSTLASGLFWTLDGPSGAEPSLVIGPSLGEVVSARTSPTALNETFLLRHAVYAADPFETPYAEVHRVPPGYALHWEHICAEPRRIPWCTPDVLPTATAEGSQAVDAYRDAVDRAVDDLDVEGEPLFATLSGGLDSSFVVASLARRASADRPIHAMCFVPHPDAPLGPIGMWDPDDSAVAASMESAYPGVVRLTRVANWDRVQPLDVAEEIARQSWAPAPNPTSMVWFRAMGEIATDAGASRLFVGATGNASFSFDHDYVPLHYLARGNLVALARLAQAGRAAGLTLPWALRRQVAGPLWRQARLRLRRPGSAYAETIGLGRAGLPEVIPRFMTHARVMEWARGHTGAAVSLQESATVVPWADPFSASRVLAAASALTPLEWARSPLTRGLARRLGEGRVPDEIRLRTRRGGQSWDAWFIVHDQRDRYLDELAAIESTPVLGPVVDVPLLVSRARAWPWGRPEGPPPLELFPFERLLALSIFIRVATARLASLTA